MVDTRVVLSGFWVAVMLTYLWGDVLRSMAGDVDPGKLMAGVPATQGMLLLIAVIIEISPAHSHRSKREEARESDCTHRIRTTG